MKKYKDDYFQFNAKILILKKEKCSPSKTHIPYGIIIFYNTLETIFK